MKSKCGIFEIIVLYLFSACYVVKEFFDRVFAVKPGLSGQLFMKGEGRTALITGGTSGIGLETARKLLSFGMNIIIGSNVSVEESEKCLEELRIQFPRCKVEIWYVDMSSMDSVKAFAEKFLLSGLPLHVLVNNAGVMFAPYEETKDGFESHFAINYLSHCLLTKLLLPRLKQSASSNCCSRIVNVSSCLHYLGKVDLQAVKDVTSYCPHQSYMQSKLYQVMFTMALSRYLKKANCPVMVNVVHPGVVYTRLYRHVWWASYLCPLILQKPVKGAETCAFAALSAKLEHSGGKYIENFRSVKPSSVAQDVPLQTRLWNETWNLLGPWLEETEENKLDLD